MPIHIDPITQKIIYKGQVCGELLSQNGRTTLSVNLEFTSHEDAIVALSHLSHGLSFLPENQPPKVLLSVETSEHCIDEEFDVLRLLTEKQIKRGNYIWDFHKTDADTWPSKLHGHDYDKGLVLNAITGDIYDKGTKQRCKTLKVKHRSYIQSQLRNSDDFSAKVKKLIDQKKASS